MSEHWVTVEVLANLPQGSTRRVEFAGEPVCLYNLKGEICATQDTCPHALASLAEGFVDGDVIECPLHQAAFDIRTGKVMSPPATESLRVYETRVVGDEIQLLSPSGAN